MMKRKSLITFLVIMVVFLFIFTGCGEPGEPDSHIGPDEEEETEEETAPQGSGGFTAYQVKTFQPGIS